MIRTKYVALAWGVVSLAGVGAAIATPPSGGISRNELAVGKETDNIDIQRPRGVGFDEISALEASTGIMFRSSSNLVGGASPYGHFDASTYRWLANATYVTGAHSAKVGIQIMHGGERFTLGVIFHDAA